MNGLKRVRFRLERVIEDANRKLRTPSLRILRIKGSSNDKKMIFIDSVVMGRSGTNSDLTFTLNKICGQYLLSNLVKELEKLKGGMLKIENDKRKNIEEKDWRSLYPRA